MSRSLKLSDAGGIRRSGSSGAGCGRCRQCREPVPGAHPRRSQCGAGAGWRAPLAWDTALGNAAASYAMQLALTNSFQHSDRRARPGTGENLWMGTHGAYSYEAMVGGWASERRYFVPGVFPTVSRSGNWEDVGHYTQMIWPTTTRVGCALASNARSDYPRLPLLARRQIDGRPVPYMALERHRHARALGTSAARDAALPSARFAVTRLRLETCVRDTRCNRRNRGLDDMRALSKIIAAAALAATTATSVSVAVPANATTRIIAIIITAAPPIGTGFAAARPRRPARWSAEWPARWSATA